MQVLWENFAVVRPVKSCKEGCHHFDASGSKLPHTTSDGKEETDIRICISKYKLLPELPVAVHLSLHGNIGQEIFAVTMFLTPKTPKVLQKRLVRSVVFALIITLLKLIALTDAKMSAVCSSKVFDCWEMKHEYMCR